MLVLFAGAVAGIVVNLIAGQEPGNLLGFFVIVGAIAAVLSIQRGQAYLLFPVPALALFAGAVVVGKVHDAKLGSSAAGLGAGFTQWVGGIFFPAVVATIVVVLLGGLRWVLGRQLVGGQSLLDSGGPARPGPPMGNARPAPKVRRPPRNDDLEIDDWADDNPFEDQQAFKTAMMPAARPDGPDGPDRPGRTPAPAGSGGGNQRPPRDRGLRQDRDQWGDPRTAQRPQQTDPRSQGSGPRPQQTGPRPQQTDRSQGSGPRPQQTGPRPQQTDRSQGSGPRPQQTGPRPQGSGPRPQQTGPRPEQSGPRPQQGGGQSRGGSAPRPSFNPNPNPSNPNQPRQRPRRNPPEGWNPR
jgi:hypothetical protein